MISDTILNFLEELSKNNNKEWFQNNKLLYQKSKHEFESFVDLLIHEINAFDKDIRALTSKDCIFKIFRDIRFSKDKTPYKTNFGAYISKGGRKGGYAGYYLHIEPNNYFLAGGIYMPSAPVLRTIRNDIYHNIEEFKEILQHKKFNSYFGGLRGEKLTNPPKGFTKEFPDIELLKYKSYTIFKEINKKDIQDKNFLSFACDIYKAMLPFTQFLNQAIENEV